MIASEVQRTWPPYVAGEREMLEAWLDFHRATLLQKCAGLTGEQLRQAACPPSNLTLLGLLRHMALVERQWFREIFAREEVEEIYFVSETNPDSEFDDVARADVEADFTIFAHEVERARRAAAGHSLDEIRPHPNPKRNTDLTLRWIYVHMIEEYARHNGHADLLREAVDGTTGV
jgi:uncharacterized damage-inducible protein DinB